MANRDHIEIRQPDASELSSEDVEKGPLSLEGSAGDDDYIVWLFTFLEELAYRRVGRASV